MELFNTLLVNPLTNLMVAIYLGLFSMGVPYALGWAIIVLTVVIRLILYPLTASQLKMSKKMQELSPRLSELKEKYKNDPKRLQQETMQLYAASGVNPLAGCLPTIAQMIVLFALYVVLTEIAKDPKTAVNHINSLVYSDSLRLTRPWDTTFFGLPLTKKPSELLSTIGFAILLIPVLTGVLQFIQSAMMFPSAPAKKPTKKDAKAEPSVDFAQAMQTNTQYILPILIGYFSFTFPLALALYWNTFTIFGIIQQYRVGGLGKLGEWHAKFIKKSSPSPKK